MWYQRVSWSTTEVERNSESSGESYGSVVGGWLGAPEHLFFVSLVFLFVCLHGICFETASVRQVWCSRERTWRNCASKSFSGVSEAKFKKCVNGGAGGILQPMSMLMAVNPLEKEVRIQDVAMARYHQAELMLICRTWSIPATCSDSPLIHHSLRWISWKSVLRVPLFAHSRWCLGAVVEMMVYPVNSCRRVVGCVCSWGGLLKQMRVLWEPTVLFPLIFSFLLVSCSCTRWVFVYN